MASEVAHPEPVAPSLPGDTPLTNGDHDRDQPRSTEDGQNTEVSGGKAVISKTDTSLDVSNVSPPVQDAAGPTPIDDVAPGIAPVADFIPKDAPTSHPTPPPDEPLGMSEAVIDTEMVAADSAPQKEPTPAPSSANDSLPATAPAPATTLPATETSLVRPREEDDGDEDAERAAKRSRTEEAQSQEMAVDVTVASANDASVAQPEMEASFVPLKTETDVDVPMNTRDSEAPAAVSAESKPTDTPFEAPADKQMLGVSPAPVANGGTTPEPNPGLSEVTSQPSEADVKPSVEASVAPAASEAAQSSTPVTHKYSKEPMTQAQLKVLQEKMKNLKKTKNSVAFLYPVDPVTLNIPTYRDIVKQPMDLHTMDQKLKAGRYHSVQEFADDFDLIIHNTRVFNGPAHAVTQAGMAMDAYFRRMMESVPPTGQPAPQKAQPKKPSPKPAPQARRESRSAAVAVVHPVSAAQPATLATSAETFALQADGTPQIRRESTTNRPARAIKPPPARELAYAKPKRKEHQLELKFSEHVLNQIRSQKYVSLNSVFQAPVDPVALNIPHYRQVVKHPMDLGTMAQKLKHGQYGRASEVKKDFDLMISNCVTFNPPGNMIRDMGIQLQREFEELWRGKEAWEKKRKSEAQRANSASADEESVDEEEEEEEEETGGDQNQTIKALQKQLADMQNALAGLGKQPPTKQKKAKAPKAASKKASAPAPKSSKASAAKPKPKKGKQVTYEEKQEISEAVGNMDGPQVEELTRIITSNCKKYADQEEMELEIDDLPNDVQSMLLSYVRSIFGKPNKGRSARQESPDDLAAVDDDDFEPERRGGSRGGGGSKRKKHKPMGKEQQQATINNIQKQLAQFSNTGPNGSASPTGMGFPNQAAETSGDDESEESEEE